MNIWGVIYILFIKYTVKAEIIDTSLITTTESNVVQTATATITASIITSDNNIETESLFTTLTSTPTPTIKSKVSIYTSPRHSTTTIKNVHNPSPNTTFTNTSDPLVQFQLDCKIDDLYCSKVNKAVRAAIDEFTRVIYIKNSLLIFVKYYNFCDKICANQTFGWGTPTSQFTLPFEDGADLNYVYPQALAKQLAPYSSTSVWSKYDIEIEINHDLYMNSTEIEQAILDGWNGTGVPLNGKYWLMNDQQEIQPYQIDLRYIVLHQLMHGLGMISSWAAYFWTDASPFRTLVDGVIDPIELQLVTPGPYWFINQDTGPAYVTGFQPTMIFDKYLVNVETELNETHSYSLSEVAFDMQDFCVQNHNAFIVNFIRLFNEANQSTMAHKLWMSMSEAETLSFHFQSPSVANSSFNTIPYLNQTYRSMTLLTGENIFLNSKFEHMDPIINRPGLMISHLDDQYFNTPDFLMTKEYHFGQTLEQLVTRFYGDIPIIRYKDSASRTNFTLIEKRYQSPIGPGILRILDSIGYSTVLTKTNYTTDGNVKTPKSRSICDDSNSNPGIKESVTSSGIKMYQVDILYYTVWLFFFYLY